ncbi:MAG: HAD family hydrolase [Vulcanisaeta sp. AZ3]|jgi:phosphoglycolate phosphatase
MNYRSTDKGEDKPWAERVKAVVFDLDGTLVDTVPLHIQSWIETCRRLGFPAPTVDYVSTLMGLRALDIAARLCGSENAERALNMKNEIYLSLLDNVKSIDNAPYVMRILKERGLLIGIVTSSSRHVAVKVLEITGLLKYVDALVAGDDVNVGKPNPEPLIKLLRILKLGINDVVVVGDSKYDAEMAINAGVRIVFILSDSQDPWVIPIRSLTDLLKLMHFGF